MEKSKAVGEEKEDIYGKTYLPRKFKIAVALPPRNDVDVFSNCLGLLEFLTVKKLLATMF